MVEINLKDNTSSTPHYLKDYCAFTVKAYDEETKIYFIGRVVEVEGNGRCEIIDVVDGWKFSIFTRYDTIEDFIKEWYNGKATIIKLFDNIEEFKITFTEL